MLDRRGEKCSICVSSVATELTEAKKLGVKTGKLYKKFVSATGYRGDQHAFYMMLYRHTAAGHAAIVPQKQELAKEELTLENYAEKLLRRAMEDPEMMEGKKISHQAVIAAQKVLIEKDKVRTENNTLKNAFLQLFRGQGLRLPEGMVIEGELQQSDTQGLHFIRGEDTGTTDLQAQGAGEVVDEIGQDDQYSSSREQVGEESDRSGEAYPPPRL